MAKREKELTDINIDELKHETEKAWLVVIDDEEHWIPKSVSQYDADKGVITVETWWAKKNELA